METAHPPARKIVQASRVGSHRPTDFDYSLVSGSFWESGDPTEMKALSGYRSTICRSNTLIHLAISKKIQSRCGVSPEDAPFQAVFTEPSFGILCPAIKQLPGQ
jgi:hypothetical protein